MRIMPVKSVVDVVSLTQSCNEDTRGSEWDGGNEYEADDAGTTWRHEGGRGMEGMSTWPCLDGADQPTRWQCKTRGGRAWE